MIIEHLETFFSATESLKGQHQPRLGLQLKFSLLKKKKKDQTKLNLAKGMVITSSEYVKI